MVAPRGLVFDFEEVPVLVAPLIPDGQEAGPAALRRDGYYPINHLVVVKDELLEEHPHLAEDVFADDPRPASRCRLPLRRGDTRPDRLSRPATQAWSDARESRSRTASRNRSTRAGAVSSV